jgi:hypothetical protein
MARFEVITAVSLKMVVSWDLSLYSLVNVDRRFRGAYCLHHQGPDNGGGKFL